MHSVYLTKIGFLSSILLFAHIRNFALTIPLAGDKYLDESRCWQMSGGWAALNNSRDQLHLKIHICQEVFTIRELGNNHCCYTYNATTWCYIRTRVKPEVFLFSIPI